MATLFPASKAVSRSLLSRTTPYLLRSTGTSLPLRVTTGSDNASNLPDTSKPISLTLRRAVQTRSYATEAAAPKKAVRQPKTTTTRKPRAKATTTKPRAKATTRKPRAKATTDAAPAADSDAKSKPKAARKTAARKIAKKPKPKAKKKAKPKAKPKPKKKVVSKTAKAKIDRANVLTTMAEALVRKEPKKLPYAAYTVLVTELSAKGSQGQMVAASQAWKTATSAEVERLNHVANENKAKNQVAYKKWVQEYTPNEIKRANVLRRRLNLQAKAAGKKGHYTPIHDDRLVKLPRNAFTFFGDERHGSGDFNSISIPERSRLLAREWKEMSSAEKKPFEEKSQADRARYLEEHTTVYGESPLKARIQKKQPTI